MFQNHKINHAHGVKLLEPKIIIFLLKMRPSVKSLKMKHKHINSLTFYIGTYSIRNVTSELALFLAHVLGTVQEGGDIVFDSCIYMVFLIWYFPSALLLVQ